jgi:hypothetical protein
MIYVKMDGVTDQSTAPLRSNYFRSRNEQGEKELRTAVQRGFAEELTADEAARAAKSQRQKILDWPLQK